MLVTKKVLDKNAFKLCESLTPAGLEIVIFPIKLDGTKVVDWAVVCPSKK